MHNLATRGKQTIQERFRGQDTGGTPQHVGNKPDREGSGGHNLATRVSINNCRQETGNNEPG